MATKVFDNFLEDKYLDELNDYNIWQLVAKQDMKWVLITSAFHMARAMRSFETSGWRNLTAYPVDYRTASYIDHTGWNFERNLRNLNILTREFAGQLAYRFTSR